MMLVKCFWAEGRVWLTSCVNPTSRQPLATSYSLNKRLKCVKYDRYLLAAKS
ncbi:MULTISPECIES: hypothetical protein [Chroococcidiopsis]|uniref:hypothetical protein n=1 Tax=Chroococcidiopsis TaxID=54298 RepID=UPI0002EEE796|nr:MULTISPECIES: hypothetical protein [Chroococcidiopsis]URD50469.1 hypothetical protein M5J74_00380 [Chroococcidiopsis sp. CCNUC1]